MLCYIIIIFKLYFMNFDKDKKWLAISCLQKSIRSGLVDLSEKYARRLYEVDRGYLLYRLSIIALEDISIANLSPVRKLLNTQLKRKEIEALGGVEFVVEIVKSFSSGVKDRTASDISNLSSFINKFPVPIEYLSSKELLKIYNNSDLDVKDRCFALWLLYGTDTSIKHNLKYLAHQHRRHK